MRDVTSNIAKTAHNPALLLSLSAQHHISYNSACHIAKNKNQQEFVYIEANR